MRICSDYRLRELGDDHLVIGESADGRRDARRVVRLNESAAFLWRSVAGKDFDADTLSWLLQKEYGVDSLAADADAASILAAWMKAGLVEA
ncbi:MAG: PqqD family peptide modification chaperone [Bacteroidales bacterium]|nr:PqqD family peptide modification chaperone [Bacteroidales bacterium]